VHLGTIVAVSLGLAPAALAADTSEALLRQRGEAFAAALNTQGEAASPRR
jgi:hypothetical protein